MLSNNVCTLLPVVKLTKAAIKLLKQRLPINLPTSKIKWPMPFIKNILGNSFIAERYLKIPLSLIYFFVQTIVKRSDVKYLFTNILSQNAVQRKHSLLFVVV